ncbi:unnamed protein product [Orchesella dallaii]|uniref:Dopamine N-acetyltransferase n=1 Tax=Orchesella dallaii TaxID=48710 RepID=A0ABP1RVU9_9HEXA
MEDQIQGPWGQFDIRTINPKQDIPSILTFLTENFHRDEPMGRHCPYDEAFIKDINSKIAFLLEASSHICLVATNIETGAIAGVQLQFILSKEQARKIALNAGEQSPFFQRRVMNAIYEPLNQARANLFERFGVEELVWNFVASTSKEHRGQGLASELFRRMLNLLRKEKLFLVFSIYSSQFSRRCATKLGFVEIARSRFADALDPISGLPYLPKAVDCEDFASLMTLQIK